MRQDISLPTGINRKHRLASVRKGPGVFVYDGKEYDTEFVPTILRHDGSVTKLDDQGLPVIGRDGRPVKEAAGSPVYDDEGNVRLGGPPEVKRHRVKTMVVWGKEFPADAEVEVLDHRLALKLRGMGCFKEVGEAADPRDLEILELKRQLASQHDDQDDEPPASESKKTGKK